MVDLGSVNTAVEGVKRHRTIALAVTAGAGIAAYAAYRWWLSVGGEPTVDAGEGTGSQAVTASTADQTPAVRSVGTGTGYSYDDRMTDHYNTEGHHPECPDRIRRMIEKLRSEGLTDKMTLCPPREVRAAELSTVHTPRFLDAVFAEEDPPMGEFIGDVYFSKGTPLAASLAAGSSVDLALRVWNGELLNAAGIIRPPGHHAESSKAMGFCYYNNVAVAARAVQDSVGAGEPRPRILIVDWDVHHGNGTQHMFEDDPSVLYMSLHRADNGFYPGTGMIEEVGEGEGAGFNVNVAWPRKGLGDHEYIDAFERVLMPIAREFDPDLVLVSCGFDAAEGDPLGKMRVSPEGYAYMTKQVSSLAQGRCVVLLEGGYHLTAISYSMEAVIRVMLGEEPEDVLEGQPHKLAVQTVDKVIEVHQKYWRSLASVAEM